MSKELLDLVLPRLSQRISRQLRRYREGQLDDDQFSENFESLLEQQHAWLANRGVPDVEAAITIHGALLVITSPGLKAESAEQNVPLEVVEFQAAISAAEDIAESYDVPTNRVLRRLTSIIAQYTE